MVPCELCISSNTCISHMHISHVHLTCISHMHISRVCLTGSLHIPKMRSPIFGYSGQNILAHCDRCSVAVSYKCLTAWQNFCFETYHELCNLALFPRSFRNVFPGVSYTLSSLFKLFYLWSLVYNNEAFLHFCYQKTALVSQVSKCLGQDYMPSLFLEWSRQETILVKSDKRLSWNETKVTVKIITKNQPLYLSPEWVKNWFSYVFGLIIKQSKTMELFNELAGHNWARFLNIKLLTADLREEMCDRWLPRILKAIVISRVFLNSRH